MEKLQRDADSLRVARPRSSHSATADSGLENSSAAQLFREFALQNGFVSPQQIASWDEASKDSRSSLVEHLVASGLLSPDESRLLQELAERAAQRGMSGAAQNAHSTPPPRVEDSETVSFHVPRKTDNVKLETLGDYEILSEIARGGMGVVYKAKQKKLNRLVALKVIRAGEFADSSEIARFGVEAAAAAKLDHPNIVPVFEVGQAAGRHFFSMALVEGESLHVKVQRDGPLAPTKAASLLLQAARALQFAHEKGIVHRDLKPQNLLLDRTDTVRVADFGLAKQMGSDSNLTSTGQIMGTPCYMAPEQAAGKSAEVGSASDVYALGATLYFVLTGRPPFHAGSAVETIRQVLEVDPLPPRKLNPAIPRDLETICLHCLRKESSKRYASAGELARDLQRWLEREPIVARPVGLVEKLWLWGQRHPTVAASFLAILLTVLGSAGVALHQRQANLAKIARANVINDQARAKAHVESLLTAPATGVPFALQLVEPLAQHAIPILKERFKDPTASPQQRLRAGVALAQLRHAHADFLVDQIPSAPSAECGNLIAALTQSAEAIDQLRTKSRALAMDAHPNLEVQARYAIIAMHLGDSSLASAICANCSDSTARTIFAETMSQWHGDLNQLLDILRNTKDEPLRGTVLLGLGEASLDDFPQETFAVWREWLAELQSQTPDPYTCSACRYVMQHWYKSPPVPLPPQVPAKQDRWYVNSVGLTMIRCEPGLFVRKILEAGPTFQQTAQLTEPFWLAQQETSMHQFRRYQAEQYPNAAELPAEWNANSAFAKYSADDPARMVNWEDAVRFCNWLSAQENLVPAYERVDGNWVWRDEADGYRLPTAAEWEYACRANSTTTYFFGDDTSRLSRYVTYNSLEPSPCGSKAPNGWGFFEMLGNMQEWTFDLYERETTPPPLAVDPRGTAEGRTRVLMGGCYEYGPAILSLNLRHSGNPLGRANNYGIRVARNAK